jgi:hypothetical protein
MALKCVPLALMGSVRKQFISQKLIRRSQQTLLLLAVEVHAYVQVKNLPVMKPGQEMLVELLHLTLTSLINLTQAKHPLQTQHRQNLHPQVRRLLLQAGQLQGEEAQGEQEEAQGEQEEAQGEQEEAQGEQEEAQEAQEGERGELTH